MQSSFPLLVLLLALVACASAIHIPANLHNLVRPDSVGQDLSYDPRSEATADLRANIDRDVEAPSVFSGFGVKQCVQGPADYNVLTFGVGRVGGVSAPNAEFGFGPASLAVDPANQQFVFYNAGGYQFTLANGTYTTSPNALTGVNECFFDGNNSYAQEVNDHTTLLQIRDGLVSRFYGKTPDVGSGHTHTGFNIFTGPSGVIRKLEFSQGYPVPAFFPPQSLTATGIIRYNDNCPTNGPTFAARFQLPSICWLDALPAWSTYHRFD
jgi:hypothetical protein